MKHEFDTPEKWNAFLKQIDQKQRLIEEWLLKFKEESCNYFNIINRVDGWSFKAWGDCYLHWYLTEHGDESLSLIFGNFGKVILYCDSYVFDIDKIAEYLKNERFSPLISNGIGHLTNSMTQSGAMGVKYFSFGDSDDAEFDPSQFDWIAGNQTEFLIKQIAEKVNKFQKDRAMVELINELNNLRIKY
jgi:hypothetical protein